MRLGVGLDRNETVFLVYPVGNSDRYGGVKGEIGLLLGFFTLSVVADCCGLFEDVAFTGSREAALRVIPVPRSSLSLAVHRSNHCLAEPFDFFWIQLGSPFSRHFVQEYRSRIYPARFPSVTCPFAL